MSSQRGLGMESNKSIRIDKESGSQSNVLKQKVNLEDLKKAIAKNKWFSSMIFISLVCHLIQSY